MVGWILAIIVAIIMLYVLDAVVYVVTWFVSYLGAAFSAVGIHIEVFDYLDMLYPYFRTTVQIVAIGIILVAVFHITMAIREQI
jgi:TPP-dependent pyruvate/acetoin dehydrogenase alpha subunit